MVFKIIKIISEHTKVEKEKINIDTTFESLEIDSLTLFIIILTFEEEFDIEISNEDAESLKSVEDAVNYIDRRCKIH
jgi:acyl carrier protein